MIEDELIARCQNSNTMTDDELISNVEALLKQDLIANGPRIQNHLAKGKYLAKLKEKSKMKFSKILAELGIHPRVGNRLVHLGNSLWDFEKLKNFGLLEVLPNALEKLELLCKLSETQLADFTKGVDLVGMSTKDLKKEVKKCLDVPPISKPRTSSTHNKLDRDINAGFKRISNLLIKANSGPDFDEVEQNRLENTVRDGVRQLYEILKPSQSAEVMEPPVDGQTIPQVDPDHPVNGTTGSIPEKLTAGEDDSGDSDNDETKDNFNLERDLGIDAEDDEEKAGGAKFEPSKQPVPRPSITPTVVGQNPSNDGVLVNRVPA